jgi:hypothetical protein
MVRLSVLEKEINKGIAVDEKSNILINNWSPNNVRRLIIGLDFAIVNYFVTGPKYNKLVEIVDFRRVKDKDLESIEHEPQKYKSILSVLTTGRICSSVEEIIFCSQGYPTNLLTADCDTTKLATGNANLENRFTRLRHVSIVDTDVQTIAKHLENARSAETLLLDVLKENNIPLTAVAMLHEENWWKGISLRPKYYSMDADILPKYFNKLKATKGSQEREDLLDELSSKQDSETLRKTIPAINAILRFTFNQIETGNEIFNKAPIISKAEWASVIETKNTFKGIRKELAKNEARIKDYRRIDFDKILKVAIANDTQQEDIQNIEKFRDIIFNHILNNEEEFKRDSNKAPFAESMESLKKLVFNVFIVEVNIVYLAFAKYLTRNTPEYVEFFQGRLKMDTSQIVYTRTTMEFCNNHIESGYAKQAMDKIGATEVLVDQYTIPARMSNSTILLEGLSQVN